MSQPSFWNRPLVRLAAVSFAALFIAAPTPGNVGGCSGSSAAVAPGPNPGETSEWEYFDQSLCAGMCWRLRSCEVLCDSLEVAPTNSTCGGMNQLCCTPHNTCAAGLVCSGAGTCLPCNNNDTAPYAQCVRGGLNQQIFGTETCPHDCATLQVNRYHQAYQFDVQACLDALGGLTCNSSGAGSIGAVFQAGTLPPECINVCY